MRIGSGRTPLAHRAALRPGFCIALRVPFWSITTAAKFVELEPVAQAGSEKKRPFALLMRRNSATSPTKSWRALPELVDVPIHWVSLLFCSQKLYEFPATNARSGSSQTTTAAQIIRKLQRPLSWLSCRTHLQHFGFRFSKTAHPEGYWRAPTMSYSGSTSRIFALVEPTDI